jgi:hypothetical protein
LVPAACQAIVNAEAGANKAEAGLNRAAAHRFFAGNGRGSRLEFATAVQSFCRIGVTESRPVGAIAAEFKEFR